MNGWKSALINALIAGLAAFGGLQIGIAKSETRDEGIIRYQVAQDARLDRIEAKVDWLISQARRR